MSPSFWKQRSVTVTGGAGFLGRRVVEGLQRSGCRAIAVPRSLEYDLRQQEAIERMFRDTRPQVIIHLAAVVGGIGANQMSPGQFFYDNAVMGIQLLEAARHHRVEKIVLVGTVCSYPAETPAPFCEEALWAGYPEETNAPYGMAKKMLLVQAQAYRQQYGLSSIYLLPANLYGPGDHFDLQTSHVIPALIRKFIEAKAAGSSQVVLWGSGTPTREFLYVDDAAEGLLLAAEQYSQPQPVNLGTGKAISISDLAALIQRLVGYPGTIVWDRTKPDGQRVRRLSTERAEREFGFRAKTSLEAGLRATIAWYLNHQQPVGASP